MRSAHPTSGELTPSDAELTRRMAGGDTHAFDVLFAQYGAGVYGFLLRMTGDAARAEDVTQETFLRFWRARSTFVYGGDSGASLRTYLFTVARRRLLDVCKRPDYDTRAWDEAVQDALPSRDPGPEQALLATELVQTLEDALAALPPALREVTLLREVEDMTYEQIAAIVNCPTGTVKSRLNAARVQLRAAVRAYLGENCDA